MAHINLLPWREEKRKEQQKQFASITFLSVVLVGLVILAIHFQYSRMINYQNSRNQFLEREISKVEKQIKEIEDINKEKQRLLARMEVIQQLQHNRPEIVHLFDEMVRIIPDGTYFTKFKQQNKSLNIEGLAQSNARVSALMRNMEASDWFMNPVLDVIKSDKDDAEATRKFILRVTQTSKKSKTDKK